MSQTYTAVTRWVFPFALVVFLSLSTGIAAADERVIADFEASAWGDWQATGEAFGDGPAEGTLPQQMAVGGFEGSRLVNSYHAKDASTGTLTSPLFEISNDHITFLVGGGRHEGKVGIELLIDDTSVRTATGTDSETLTWHSWDVRDLRGRQARVRIFDNETGGWGHSLVDQITLTDSPRQPPREWRIEEYRRSAGYYREPYRPRYHFTPELNWMNDPNGLVYFDGEYHLFYQHNPHGNEWGHMSWGHAVSTDLVHWNHLPIALHEEYGVMIFSGCCVVDHHNTSGFGIDGKPPMVAIYTGHGHGEQTQDIAWSNDRGRTWTKYLGNPVIDLDEADFRDPKVFWHTPTKKWVMVVTLAADRKLQFYGSPDLKEWSLLSEFGPAGAKEKPNWECPDLFELPINGTDQTKWVLEVDMGSGAIAGGSGGEYFIGEFDGETFTPDDDRVRWVDYGRDFYAPISWANIPEEDGRRIWIGWINNWQTALVPTHPWRSAMSVPRTLSLEQTDHGLLMSQTPVRELEALHGEHIQLAGRTLPDDVVSLADEGVAGDTLEIIAEFTPGDAKQCGLHVRVGEHERTIIGYDAEKQELFVDRRASGNVDFHPAFAGRHAGPAKLVDGRIRFRVLVDTSSVEVFSADGTTVITDRIFPSPSSQGVYLFAVGEGAELTSLEAWTLKSAVRR